MILPPLPRWIMRSATRLQREEQAFHIDGEDPVIAFLGDLLDRRHVEDRGIVDENVDTAGFCLHLGDQRLIDSIRVTSRWAAKAPPPVSRAAARAASSSMSAMQTRAPSRA